MGWLYITYHLLREPETAIEKRGGKPCHSIWDPRVAVYFGPPCWFRSPTDRPSPKPFLPNGSTWLGKTWLRTSCTHFFKWTFGWINLFKLAQDLQTQDSPPNSVVKKARKSDTSAPSPLKWSVIIRILWEKIGGSPKVFVWFLFGAIILGPHHFWDSLAGVCFFRFFLVRNRTMKRQSLGCLLAGILQKFHMFPVFFLVTTSRDH